MPYGWLTGLGQGVQSDMRAVQPMKNLRMNRAILAEEDRIARENAARRMAELEAPPQSSMPMLTQQEDLAPVAMPEAPKAMPYIMGRGGQAEANAAWNSLAFQQQKEIEALRARAEANEDITDEFNKMAARHQRERAQATQQYGDAAPETKAGIQELLGTFGQDKTGKIKISTKREYATPLTAPTQGFIAGSLAQDPAAGYRGQMILLDEMNSARSRALPRLQGTEGLDEYGEQIKTTSSGLSQMITQAGLDNRANLTASTAIEKERMRGQAQAFAIDAMNKREAAKKALENAKLDLERDKYSERWANNFAKLIANDLQIAQKEMAAEIASLRSQGALMIDATTGRIDENQSLYRQVMSKYQNRQLRAQQMQALAYSANPEDHAKAVNMLGENYASGVIDFSSSNVMSEPTNVLGFTFGQPNVLHAGAVAPAPAAPSVTVQAANLSTQGGSAKSSSRRAKKAAPAKRDIGL
jgi:hypothetical protein